MNTRRRRRWRGTVAGLGLGVVLSASGTLTYGSVDTALHAAGTGSSGTITASIIDAAIGASETVGIGAKDRLRQAWPQLLFNAALPESAVLYNFGIPGATVADSLDEQLPAAVAVHPTLVTIWLNVNDLVAGVPPATYEAQLTRLVGALHQAGVRRILIANTPYLDRLPAYLACGLPARAAPACPLREPVPNPAQLNALVDSYNAAITRVAQLEAAIVVDLHAQGEVPDLHPDWVSADGFHPNALGYKAIAIAFQTVLSANAP